MSHTALFNGGRVTGLVKFDAEECLRLIEANRVQWVNFVPTMMHRIWALPDEVRNALRPVEPADRVSHGRADAAMAEGKMDRVARAGAHLRTLWRHRSGRAPRSFPASNGSRTRARSARSAKPARLRIIGEDGNDVAPGETGEIYFLPNDGAGSTYHYLGAEPKRRADGWESLGDIGRLDAEGYLYLGDRLADMILRGGANIYPAEVEAAVTAHPDVRSCVVVGLPDPEFGQRVHAILELDRQQPMRKPSPTAWAISWPTGSAATSIRKVSRSSASACATIPARSAAPCCATSARLAEGKPRLPDHAGTGAGEGGMILRNGRGTFVNLPSYGSHRGPFWGTLSRRPLAA